MNRTNRLLGSAAAVAAAALLACSSEPPSSAEATETTAAAIVAAPTFPSWASQGSGYFLQRLGYPALPALIVAPASGATSPAAGVEEYWKVSLQKFLYTAVAGGGSISVAASSGGTHCLTAGPGTGTSFTPCSPSSPSPWQTWAFANGWLSPASAPTTCLRAGDFTIVDVAPLTLEPCSAVAQQIFVPVGFPINITNALKDTASGGAPLCLTDVSVQSQPFMTSSDCNGSASQVFTLPGAGSGNDMSWFAPDFASILHGASCLEIYGQGATRDYSVGPLGDAWVDSDSGCSQAAPQAWMLPWQGLPAGTPGFMLENAVSFDYKHPTSSCLNVVGGSSASGTPVHTWSCSDTAASRLWGMTIALAPAPCGAVPATSAACCAAADLTWFCNGTVKNRPCYPAVAGVCCCL